MATQRICHFRAGGNPAFLLTCGIVLSICHFAARGEERASVGTNAGDPRVTQESANHIEQELSHATACSFNDEKLEKACQYFARRHQISIWIDRAALSDEGVNSDQQVTLQMSNVTLESALNLLLEPLGLAYVIEDGVLKITTQAKADEKMSTRVYPVGDLVHGDYTSLMKIIQQSTSGKWIDLDQEGGSITPFRNTRSLVIRHTQKAHRETEGILAALRQSKKLQRLSSIATDQNEPVTLTPVNPTKASRSRSSSPAIQNPPPPVQWSRFQSAGG